MNKQRTARIMTIINNVRKNEEEPDRNHLSNAKDIMVNNSVVVECNVKEVEEEPHENHLNNEQELSEYNKIVTITDKDVITTTHSYCFRLRESIKIPYCEDNDNEVNEDFSPVVSEYLPSPERLIQHCHSSSSIGGDSDYVDAETQKILSTPSTISNISLFLDTAVNFIASPTVVYTYDAHKISDTSEAHNDCVFSLTPNSGSEYNKFSKKKTQRSSKRCLNEMFLSLPSTSSSIDAHDQQEEPTPLSPLETIDLDETLQPTNTSDSILTETTITGNESLTSNQNHQDLNIIGISNTVIDHLSSENHSPNRSTDVITNNIGSEQQAEDENTESTQKPNTRERKRYETKDSITKKLKNSGEAYEGSRSKKKYAKKVLKASCKCSKKCGEKITSEQRQHIMKKYYELGDHERQWQYIVNHTVTEDVKRITVVRKRTRTQTVKYFFTVNMEKVQVCKTFFINTLSISHQTVYTALEKIKSDESLIDKRGHHVNRPRRMSIETEESIIRHIQLFPNVEAHYVRQNSTKKYLSELLNISKMYRLYKDWFAHENVECLMATKRQYETIFNTRFNFSFYKPKKDQCSKCSRYRQADPTTQETLQEIYDKHQKNKERVRQIKKDEKESIQTNSETTVAIFVLEKVLNIPQSEVGAFHYKRKFPIYNFTVYDATRSKGYCYVWHAQIAKRGANEIGSCLWQFLLNQKQKGIQNISFYSDGCCGQNKNRFIFALYIFAAQKLELNITHRFFETGHGQSEGDSMHSNIERELKNRVVYTPDQMYAIIMNAKVNGEKYNVIEMSQNEFFNLKELITNKNWVKDDKGQKISWTQIMEVSVSYLQPSILKHKYDFDAEYSQLATETVLRLRNKRGTRQAASLSTNPSPAAEPELQVLYTEPLPISKALYDDLISLCKAGDIPSYYRAFYESLTYGNIYSGTNDDNEED